MGQNRKIRKGQSNDLSVEEQELIDDTAAETRLLFVQFTLIAVLIALAVLREIFFPSQIAIMEALRTALT